MIEIDRNTPIPEKLRRGRKQIYPYKDMKVGDSFLYTDHLDDPNLACMRISAMACMWGKRNGVKFSCRTVKEGIKVFRIE